MFSKDKNFNFNILYFLFFSIFLISFILYKYYINIGLQAQIQSVNNILDSNDFSKNSCEIILGFNKSFVSDDNFYFDESKYDKFHKSCDLEYNISNSDLNENFCSEVIKYSSKDFEDEFIILEDFKIIQNRCVNKFLKVSFGTGTFFDIQKDFKSSVNIDFSLDFYDDKGEVNSSEFIENRQKAKQKLISLLDIKPLVNIDPSDIILYKKRAILNLDLKPETNYTFNLTSFDTDFGARIDSNSFNFSSPKHSFFGFKINQKLSLFTDNQLPSFSFYNHNSSNNSADLRICKIDEESYSKIEVYDEFPDRDFRRNFFKGGIDKINSTNCKIKTIYFDKGNLSGSLNNVKKEFDFNKEISSLGNLGFYYVTFDDPNYREFDNKIQKPVFFGVINSHITMKLSFNKKGFFFVNDFFGNPLPNQEINVRLNDFVSKKSSTNDYSNNNDKSTYYSPFEKNVLGDKIYLGKTDKNGILEVDLSGKIDDAFKRTLDSYNYSWDGNLNSLLFTSSSNNYLSHVTTEHNGGITPWNFGYSAGSWWYGKKSQNMDDIVLQKWGSQDIFNYHIFTDRKIYLPGEEVHINGIIRNSSNLSIPNGEKVNLIVNDSKNKNLLTQELIISDFGSISQSFKLNKNSALGYYNIIIEHDSGKIGNSGFSVEVFKNPKFRNEITLETKGLNGNLVKIDKTELNENKFGSLEKYIGNFFINASLSSKYYNGSVLKNVDYTYKVYRQQYYDDNYWQDCYYGCYWEPQKELYTEGKGKLDGNGSSNFEIPIKFESSYDDYKYIVEVTVEDNAGDIISSSNSVIAKLSSEYKKWDFNSGININSIKRFYDSNEKIKLKARLNNGNFTKFYNDRFLLIIKKKEYDTKIVEDVRGYLRPVTSFKENIKEIIKVNTNNFDIKDDGSLEFEYLADGKGEYIFEFGKINANYFLDPLESINYFQKEIASGIKYKNELSLSKKIKSSLKVNYDNLYHLSKYCDSKLNDCSRASILKEFGCNKKYIDSSCVNNKVVLYKDIKLSVDDLIDSDSKEYFTIISYSDEDSSNPIVSDNKIQILSEKISYKIGETARILIRLPQSNGKILLTKEKYGVVSSELIDVNSNIFFKEFVIDDSFVPNSYIGAVFIPPYKEEFIPEYKVGYTEIVVDKTDKKSFIDIKTDKKIYEPRETVNLDIKVVDSNGKPVKSELTIMVVDDSLISLLGNVNLNTLEKIYKKLPFRIQTSITNIAMLKNYYFSRRGIVGGSGFGNFKGGDSLVSSRNIFRNTAFYKSSLITNNLGKANVLFNLPDSLTNFRIMVISNSKRNLFGYNSEFIEVRKNIVIEDKTPLILRNGDTSNIGSLIFNNTDDTISLKVELETSDLNVDDNIKKVFIPKNSSKFVTWDLTVPYDLDKIDYKIKAIGSKVDFSDVLEGSIEVKSSPLLITNIIKNISVGEFTDKAGVSEVNVSLPYNIDLKKSKVDIIVSNNKLTGIDSILKSLESYPYGCIEQTISSILPNAILLNFSNFYPNVLDNKSKILENIQYGIKRIKSMQLDSGGFTYWDGESYEASLQINTYVLSSLIDMQKVYSSDELNIIIENSIRYLNNKFQNDSNLSQSDKINLMFVLNKSGKSINLEVNTDKLNINDLLNYTYGLYYNDSVLYSSSINNNIDKLVTIFNNPVNGSYYNSLVGQKSLFASLILDFGYDNNYIDNLIGDLYSKNWSSYYISTKTKNQAFNAFFKYLEKNGIKKETRFGFSLGNILNRENIFFLGAEGDTIKKFEYSLEDILFKNDTNFNFRVANLSKSNLYADLILKQYPKDLLKVKPYGNKFNIRRDVYEILNESNLSKCSNYWNYKNLKYSQSLKTICDNSIRLVKDNTYKKGSLYMINVSSIFKDSGYKSDFVIEDYLPGSFRVINSNFQTESISLRNSAKNNNYSWDYVEYKPNIVMAHKYNLSGDKNQFSYYVRADFAGIYTHPPVTGYFMYNPSIRSHSSFNIIEVK